jgi:hypothetical protein
VWIGGPPSLGGVHGGGARLLKCISTRSGIHRWRRSQISVKAHHGEKLGSAMAWWWSRVGEVREGGV